MSYLPELPLDWVELPLVLELPGADFLLLVPASAWPEPP